MERGESVGWILMYLAIVTILTIVIATIPSRPVWAHSWYAPECCSGQDCRPVSVDEVEEVEKGCWRHIPTNSTFCGEQVRPSQDKNFHVCIYKYGGEDGKEYNSPRCIYILQGF